MLRGAAATNAPSPPPATLSNDPLEAPQTAPGPRAGLSERAPPSHLSGNSWPAQPYMRLILNYGTLLSSFAFKSNLRRYILAEGGVRTWGLREPHPAAAAAAAAAAAEPSA